LPSDGQYPFSFAGLKPSNHLALLSGIVFSGMVVISGLCVINLSAEVEDIAPSANTGIYWLETGLLFCYLLLHLLLSWSLRREAKST